MKYARLVAGRYIDVWRVPEDFPDLATLQRCLPLGGFLVVDDAVQSSAIDNGDGTFTNPTPAIAIPASAVFQSADFGPFLSKLLDPDPLVGRSKLRQILEAAAARAGTAASDYRTRDFKDFFYAAKSFDKATVGNYLTDLVASGIITNNQKNAVVAAWPNAKRLSHYFDGRGWLFCIRPTPQQCGRDHGLQPAINREGDEQHECDVQCWIHTKPTQTLGNCSDARQAPPG